MGLPPRYRAMLVHLGSKSLNFLTVLSITCFKTKSTLNIRLRCISPCRPSCQGDACRSAEACPTRLTACVLHGSAAGCRRTISTGVLSSPPGGRGSMSAAAPFALSLCTRVSAPLLIHLAMALPAGHFDGEFPFDSFLFLRLPTSLRRSCFLHMEEGLHSALEPLAGQCARAACQAGLT